MGLIQGGDIVKLEETQETLSERIYRYIPPEEELREYDSPSSDDLKEQSEFLERFPAAKLVFRYSHQLGKPIFVPPQHPLNKKGVSVPYDDYGQRVFEGLSLEPIVENDVNGQPRIVGGNLILFGPRLTRATRSVETHHFNLPMSMNNFGQAIVDLGKVLGSQLLSSNGRPSRAYVRPAIFRGNSNAGVNPPKGFQTEMVIEEWNWPFYHPEETYTEGANVVAYLDLQRHGRIWAKEAANYPRGTLIGYRKEIMQEKLGIPIHECLFLAPFWLNPETGKVELVDFSRLDTSDMVKAKGAIFADGAGEEISTVRGNLMIYPPMEVNRLGGTTLDYAVAYMAPRMGVETQVGTFGLTDFESGETSLLMLGNAAKIVAVKRLIIANSACEVVADLELPIVKVARQFVLGFEDEVTGRIPPSHPKLLTGIVFDDKTIKARETIYSAYPGWVNNR